MEMRIVNLTPHTINVVGAVEVTIPASGTVARCREVATPVDDVNGIPVVVKTFGDVVDLPEPQADTVYIVSALVAAAAAKSGRSDVLSPGDLVRDADGKIVGCGGFCRPA